MEDYVDNQKRSRVKADAVNYPLTRPARRVFGEFAEGFASNEARSHRLPSLVVVRVPHVTRSACLLKQSLSLNQRPLDAECRTYEDRSIGSGTADRGAEPLIALFVDLLVGHFVVSYRMKKKNK